MKKGKLRFGENGRVLFWCAGCDGAHQIYVGSGDGPRWTFDGNADNPTFAPSVLVTGHMDGHEMRCHSFVRSGRIEYLSDCSHSLAGQTIDLPDFDA